ncbi:ATP-dependent zinc protease family protein [Shewanella surugensis]|uniref:RimK/LysX family protein n=1 Tax=Shewanella surugensis TaxID=212020 RepID=A0ABT0LG68_9GAMM|nr:RimK/LysX family protein [Shewanella surugensis]MCL1126171.1 RimK/LysX family protein [Shewanella surugensis]
MKVSLKLGLLTLLFSLSVTGGAAEKKVIGATADMSVEGTGLNYIARIDTGAAKTSLNAKDIKVEDSNGKTMRHDIGKIVSFTTVNGEGLSKRMSAKIIGVSKIINSQGEERRYIVKLKIVYHGESRKVRVNLRDRSRMDYKLLIGRDWLKGQYMVDVDTARS